MPSRNAASRTDSPSFTVNVWPLASMVTCWGIWIPKREHRL